MDNKEQWKGEFGNEYTERQKEDLVYRTELFYEIFSGKDFEIDSVCEFGANIGENIRAIRLMEWTEELNISAIEINPKCCEELRKIEGLTVYEQSVTEPISEQIEYKVPNTYGCRPLKADLVFTRGVLIHLPEEDLLKTVDNMIATSNKYILVAEYWAPKREMIEYRGMKDMMWRDEYIGMFILKGCRLLDTGFDYKYGITWALLKKEE